MTAILNLPEMVALNGPAGLIRIPNQIDVPVTDRVLRLIDTPEFQRLTRISQLGLVSFVYPAAHHNRFEHSLGVFRMALLFLQQLAHQSRFTERVTERDATLLMLAALLHDIGHWPFCHPIEDLGLAGLPTHEEFGRSYIDGPNIGPLLRQDWNVEPCDVIDLINKRSDGTAGQILGSILSGPIDIDKMDYLYRDSLHAGVPYGQNFDSPRLIRSLCLNQSGDRLAISHKGKTAAELMVFARYVMFSEVYWHHAVRSATAMFQRSFFEWYQRNQQEDGFAEKTELLFCLPEVQMIRTLQVQNGDSPTCHLLDALFGPRRTLYKRVASYSIVDGESIYREMAQRPYRWLAECSQQLGCLVEKKTGRRVGRNRVLIDAPPVGLEVQFNVQVFYEKENLYRDLGSVSPVVQTLAQRQFDDFVKQVRIFIDPDLLPIFSRLNISELVQEAIANTNQSPEP